MAAIILRIVVIVLALSCSVSSASDKLNVLLISVDDLGIQLSCYGDPIARMAHIDELARHWVQFP